MGRQCKGEGDNARAEIRVKALKAREMLRCGMNKCCDHDFKSIEKGYQKILVM